MLQLAPPAKLPVTQVEVGSIANGDPAGILNELIVTAVLSVLCSVTVFSALFVLMAALPKLTAVVDTKVAGTPVALSETVCGLLAAL